MFNQPEDKKVDFDVKQATLAEQQQNTFLSKLSDTVKQIGEYQTMIGLDKGERKMKMQGVMRSDCKIDVTQHFARYDAKVEKA